MAAFDPNAAALPDSGVFGLPTTEADARFVLLPVPFDATTSYRRGAAGGPNAILAASRQVDLHDREVGDPHTHGIFLRAPAPEIARWNDEARAAADPIIAAGGAIAGDDALATGLARVNELSALVNDRVYRDAAELLRAGKIPCVIGGDHATPFGAIRAYAEAFPGLGVLHVDAHADLRDAYEGFTFSHASIMHNVMTRLPSVAKLVQVGVRDYGEAEAAFQDALGERLACHFDADIAADEAPFSAVARRIVHGLPADVYVSFDIDGLDPTLCPHTGTPVPGGLSWRDAMALLRALVGSGRRIVGFDVNEVAPGPDGDDWDANVGARLLYKLIGFTAISQRAR